MDRFVKYSIIFLLAVLPSTALAEVTVTAVGDIYLGGWVAPFIEEHGPDYPFELTADILEEGDVVVGNLESPLTASEDVFMEKTFTLKARPDVARGIKGAGFNVLTLANNHIMDFGSTGLSDTLEILDGYGISRTGAGMTLEEARRPAELDVNGAKVMVLAYSNTYPKEFYAKRDSPGAVPGLEKYIKKDVRLAADQADVVIVTFHWGGARTIYPKEYQKVLARMAIDNGAHLVIGHHPHVIQGVERYKEGLIFYSLGNFVFGSYSLYGAEGMIIKVVFEKNLDNGRAGYRIKSAQVIPLEVENKSVEFKPRVFGEFSDLKTISEIETKSMPFNLMLRAERGRGNIVLFPLRGE